MMNASPAIVTHRPILLFIVLALALSWWSAPVAQGSLIPHGPALAAVIVLALTEGRPGLRTFWRRLTNFRAGWWYLIGPAIIAVYLLLAFATNLLLGATVTSPLTLPTAAVLLNLLLLGGLWEEPGWSGYALPTLQERFAGQPNGTLLATLVMGIIRGLWHLPLVLYGLIPWYDALFFSMALQVIISWVYNRSGGSVPAVMVTHFASNVLAGSLMIPAFSGGERTMYYILFITYACLIALTILLRSRFQLGYAR